MSQLRAPDARPDRREGGRHGRPGTRGHSAPSRPRAAGPSPDARIRPQLLRTALLPAVAAVLSGAAAVIFTARAGEVGSSPSLWAALGGSGALAVAAVAAAYLGANRVAGQVLDRALALRRASAQGQAELQRVVEQLRNGEPVPARRPAPPPTPGADAFDLLGQEMARAQEAAVAAVVQASQLFSRAGTNRRSRSSSTSRDGCNPSSTARSRSSTSWSTRSRTPILLKGVRPYLTTPLRQPAGAPFIPGIWRMPAPQDGPLLDDRGQR
ncbi:hypothetical protein SBADM41S_07103 [Streptomyces badius]